MNAITRPQALTLLAVKIAFGALLALGFANVDIPAPATQYAMDASVIDVSWPAVAPVDACAPALKAGDALR